MSAHQSPPFLRRQLGKMWQSLRKQAGLTFEEACRRLEISVGRMSRLENGETAPDIVLAKGLLDLYGVPVNDWEPVLERVREAKKKGWWQAYGLKARGFIALEAAATSVRSFELAHIPGLLQIEEFARAGFRSAASHRPDDWIENAVQARMVRQRRLVEDQPLRLDAIIDEAVLVRPVGPAELMRAQLYNLVAMAELPNVTVQMVPFTAGLHVGCDGSFSLLSFEEGADVAFMESPADSFLLERVSRSIVVGWRLSACRMRR